MDPIDDGLTSGNGVNALIATSNHVFAGTYGDGAFISDDNGDHWSAFNDGLTAPFVLSFAIADGQLLAGTYFGGGVFRANGPG